MLLAYYIAAINIEAAYHGAVGGEYQAFDGICLTDTFQLYEQEKDLIAHLMPENSNRRTRQKALPVRVIIGNPPYSVGQGSANDNAANVAYPTLDKSIRDTYAARSDATNKNALYDSYIRAIRWASDRIGSAGIIGFVTNAGWVEANTGDGLRKCLADEFASVHVFHLRGNQRTSGDKSRREGGKIFGSGSRTPVAITFLVKNPDAARHGQIYFHDIGDYLSREEKLAIIRRFGGIGGIAQAGGWQTITPDEHGDWLGQRDGAFDAFLALGDKDGVEPAALFQTFSRGVSSARDAWAYNPSESKLRANMGRMISVYNSEVARFLKTYDGVDRKVRQAAVDAFIDTDPTKVSWNRGLKQELEKGRQHPFQEAAILSGVYRPFTRQYLYYSRIFNDMVYQMPRIFPLQSGNVENRVIQISGQGEDRSFSVLLSDAIPDLHVIHGGLCFPRYLYDTAPEPAADEPQGGLFAATPVARGGRRDAITDAGLAHFQSAYPGEAITKDDLFYYTYGLLHSEEYRARFADNLSKQLPRIPAVKRYEDFRAFVDAGRRLADLHCDYDAVEPYPVTIAQGDLRLATIPDPVKFYRVEKMKFGGKRPAQDKGTVIYNTNITITGVPLEAYDYVVNGKPALEWVMERQGVKVDKASGITWDANAYANETMGDPAYPLKLFQRVVTVSVETMKIVRALPKLEIG